MSTKEEYKQNAILEQAMDYINKTYAPVDCIEDCTDPIDFNELFFRLNQHISFPHSLKVEFFDAMTKAGFKTETANNERIWLIKNI